MDYRLEQRAAQMRAKAPRPSERRARWNERLPWPADYSSVEPPSPRSSLALFDDPAGGLRPPSRKQESL